MRRYSNTAVETTLDGGISDSDTTIVLASATGWPTLATGEKVTFRIGNEIIEAGALSGVTLSSCTRGVDGTTAAAHSTGAAVQHVASAMDIQGRKAVRLTTVRGMNGTIAAFTLSSIPQTYSTIILEYYFNKTSSGGTAVYVQMNGDTGANYHYSTTTGATNIALHGFNLGHVYGLATLPNYKGTNAQTNRIVVWDGGGQINAGNGNPNGVVGAGMWLSSSDITSITIGCTGASGHWPNTGSYIVLWGVV
jgi:hypothetical protein